MIIYRCVNNLCLRHGGRTEVVCQGSIYRPNLDYSQRFITSRHGAQILICNTPAERDYS